MNPPQSDTERYIAAQRAEWNQYADGWQTWYSYFEAYSQGVTQLIVEGLALRPDMRILDVASGTGQPALTLAELVGPTGFVTGVDLAAAMVAASQENARTRSLTNVLFYAAAAEALPFEDTGFDAVTCRFGVIHFGDVGRSLREMRRVLRPGGCAMVTAWGPPDRYEVGRVFAAFSRYLPPPPPPEPGAPIPFRFAEAGTLTAALEAAGFCDVHEALHLVRAPWPGTVEERWQAQLDLIPGLRHALATLSTAERAKVQQEVTAIYREDEDKEQHQLNHTAAVVLASARR